MTSGVVLAVAMVVSSTMIYLAFSNQINLRPQNQILHSCLSSEEKKQKRRKKRVHFAENLKETGGNGEEYRRKQERKSAATMERSCRSDVPANRMALYNGILRNRENRMLYSY